MQKLQNEKKTKQQQKKTQHENKRQGKQVHTGYSTIQKSESKMFTTWYKAVLQADKWPLVLFFSYLKNWELSRFYKTVILLEWSRNRSSAPAGFLQYNASSVVFCMLMSAHPDIRNWSEYHVDARYFIRCFLHLQWWQMLGPKVFI